MPRQSQQFARRPAARSARFQFTLITLLAVLTFASIAGALFSGLFGRSDDGEISLLFVLLSVFAPLGVMIAAAVGLSLHSLWRRWRQRRQAHIDSASTQLEIDEV